MRVAPSILAGDLACMRSSLEVCARGGAALVHVDVMDGHFVPNLTFGPPVVSALAAESEVPFDIHLMVSNPDRLLEEVLGCSPAWVSVHAEAAVHLDRTIAGIRERGIGAGVALNPATPISAVEDVLPELDFVLLMSVNPGFAGQAFIPYVLDKARRLRHVIDERGARTRIEMDGGIAEKNLLEVARAGVDVAVVGSGIFASDDPVATTQRLVGLAAGEEPQCD